MASAKTTICAVIWVQMLATTVPAPAMSVVPRSVPSRVPVPPTRMERKAGIKNPTPICGSTLMSGAMTAPARPASAAPKAKVIRSMRRVLRPRLLAIGRLAITARATRPTLVR